MRSLETPPRRGFLFAAALPALLLLAVAGQAEDRPQELQRIQLGAGIHLIQAQVAVTPAQVLTGLMFREAMPANEGMLFVFQEVRQQCFWMKNTPLPLSAAFVADDGTIVNIEDMAPGSLDRHCSVKPVRFVLEMNQGWFAQRGIAPGFRLQGGPFPGPGQAP
jgi:uncharacterized membrane protein (UPF0127 family)